MSSFIGDHLVLILAVIFIAIAAVSIGRVLGRAKRIDREGTETDAVISRVEYDRDPDGNDYYNIYARYRDDTGMERESKTGIYAVAEYKEGQKVRIRFLPGEYDLVRIVKNQ